ncbi:MAG: D-alanine--poly(phosphoribitol) ligase subunit DltA [Propionibacteriaceae bacterium]|nr:D-alanine--poly(phosphoribitol) ligase subunit DltA [Propionibacteriaceae bacterium]
MIEAVARHAAQRGGSVAHRWRGEELTYAELHRRSEALAEHLRGRGLNPGEPVLVYGHKQPLMLVSFLGCVKAGHPYIPVDSSLPARRVQAIAASSASPLLIAVEPVDLPGVGVLTADEVAALPEATGEPAPGVGLDEPFYIIYTSGSTGDPKGVQISRRAVNRFTSWALSLVPDGHQTYLNQAPFSFDLSVYELMMGLASGGTIHSIDKDQIARFRDLAGELARSDASVWVSTPSFADLCLALPEFGAGTLPRLETLIFCGEALSNDTAARLRDRFPGARVLNTYGPTESTVAVTSVVCDEELLASHPVLPVGYPKPGTTIQIWDAEGRCLADGEQGEIVIIGDTVSLGYYRRPDLSAAVFTEVEVDGHPVRAYRTGDAGYLSGGMVHFLGRLDFQIKLHGYRIEIEDIEANLRKLSGVQHGVVVPVAGHAGTITHLHAVVQLAEGVPASPLRRTAELKRALRDLVPDYMVPKTFGYVAQMPLTPNGKIDRAALKEHR